MKKVENECVGCNLPCVRYCQYRNVTRYYCDECGREDILRYYEDKELCPDCLLSRFEKVYGC